MDTYSVYLVDDEPWALVYLEKIVKWEEMGFRITGKFENSVEAFNRAAAEPPDVIFIDIRMPELDGLAFMHKALEAKLPCRFVVISGFAEFGYAQEAIRMGVVYDYCLKPIARDKLTLLLNKLHGILEETKEQKQEKGRNPSCGKSGIPGNADLYAHPFPGKTGAQGACGSVSSQCKLLLRPVQQRDRRFFFRISGFHTHERGGTPSDAYHTVPGRNCGTVRNTGLLLF